MDKTFNCGKPEPAAPEWKVYFEGNFWGHLGKDRAGTKIRLNQQFDWQGIIGSSPRCIPAAKDWWWISVCVLRRRTSAGS